MLAQEVEETIRALGAAEIEAHEVGLAKMASKKTPPPAAARPASSSRAAWTRCHAMVPAVTPSPNSPASAVSTTWRVPSSTASSASASWWKSSSPEPVCVPRKTISSPASGTRGSARPESKGCSVTASSAGSTPR
ncbi:hypothetical protein H488_0108815 [Kocuria sp. UCD-OTCP]|nr:hypothetical protein H488_0108815 [Kocuria sp. UCD-OTCP]